MDGEITEHSALQSYHDSDAMDAKPMSVDIRMDTNFTLHQVYYINPITDVLRRLGAVNTVGIQT